MNKLKNLSPKERYELWQQLQTLTEEETRECGDVALLWHLAQRLNLVEILDQSSKKREQGFSVGMLSLLMAIHRDSDPQSKLAFMDWYPKTILPELAKLKIEEVNYEHLLRSLDYWDDEAIAEVETKVFLQLAIGFGIGPKAVVWDSTSCYFEAQTNSLIKKGYSRDHRPDLPQVNIDLFMDIDSHLPLYSRSYEGNCVDVDRFPKAIKELATQFANWRPMIISDCGVISDQTLLLLKQLGYSFIFALPKKGRWLKLMLSITESELEAESGFYHNSNRIIAKHKGINLSGHRLHVHLMFNKKKAKAEALARQKAIQSCIKELQALEPKLGVRFLKSRLQIKQRLDAILKKRQVNRFISVKLLKPKGVESFQLKIRLKEQALNRQAKQDGRFLLITDRVGSDLEAKELYQTYRQGRQSAESAFGMVKGPVSLRPVFVHNEQRIKGHVFICYLAMLLRCLLGLLLRLSGLELTSNKALAVVKSIHIVKKELIGISGISAEPRVLWQLNKIPQQVQAIFVAVSLNLPKLLLDAGFVLPP